MQSEPSVPQAPKKFNSMIVVVVILVLALAGAGFWGFQQSSALKATQTELASLQGKYDSLTTENGKLTTDLGAASTELGTTKTELEKANGELSTAQADLKTSQDQNTEFQAKIALASKKAEILYAISTVKTPEDLLAVDTLIKALNDKQILAEWSKFTSAPTTESSANFLLYMIASVRDDLK